MRIELNKNADGIQLNRATAVDSQTPLKPLLGNSNLSVTDLNAEIDRLALEMGNARESSVKASVSSVMERVVAIALEGVNISEDNMEILDGVSEMTIQMDVVSTEISSEESVAATLEQEISELQKSNTALEVEIQKTEAMMESIKKMNEKTIDQKRKLELEKELARLENELASLNASHSANLSAISSKTALLSAKNARIEELKGIRDNIASCISLELSKIRDVGVLTALARALKSEVVGERLEDDERKDDENEEVRSVQEVILDMLLEESRRLGDEMVFNDSIESRKENNV